MIKRIFYLIFIVFIFISCEKKQEYTVKEEYKNEFIDKGQKASALAFKNLSAQLKDAIASSGFDGAISFCKVEAPKIMYKSSSQALANISRVSDKYRNPANKADEEEIKIIEKYIKLNSKNEKLEPTLTASASKINYYSPIKILPICLNCHGSVNKQVNPSTKELLDDLYPDDKALNYKLNDIRGLWKITYTSQQSKIELIK